MSDAARSDPAPRFDPARRRAVTFALVLVTSLSSFESTVVTTAMPTIIGDLHGLPLYSWVFSVYLLGSTITMPFYGRLADVASAALAGNGPAPPGFRVALERSLLPVFALLLGVAACAVFAAARFEAGRHRSR